MAVQEKNLLPGLGVPVSRRCRDSSLPRVLGVSPNSPISPQEWGTRGLKAVCQTSRRSGSVGSRRPASVSNNWGGDILGSGKEMG